MRAVFMSPERRVAVDLGRFRLCCHEPYSGRMKMRYSLCTFAIAMLCVLRISSSSMDQEVKGALFGFLKKLSNYDEGLMLRNGWDNSTDPCTGRWNGVVCKNSTLIVKLLLNGTGLSGSLDITLLCDTSTIARTLSVLLLDGNNIDGGVVASISRCQGLEDLNVSRNRLEGIVPESIGSLKNMKRLDISYNNFTGQLPDLSHLSGLNRLAVEFNRLSGRLPALTFSNLGYFNISYNNFSGPIPDVEGNFDETSFYGNPLLCGPPLKEACPKNSPNYSNPSLRGPPLEKACPKNTPNSITTERWFMGAGYSMLSLVLLGVIFVKLYDQQRKPENGRNANKVGAAKDDSGKSSPFLSFARSATEIKMKVSRSETSGTPATTAIPAESRQEENTPAESGPVLQSNSLVILSSTGMSCMTFDELLRAPAELLGWGKYASLYRVECGDGMAYTVKRIKEWGISCVDFTKRMQKIGQVKHPNLLPAIAFYSSKQEKLLVYEYRPNGSLLRLLQGNLKGGDLGWGWRLKIAATTADVLAHLHQELHDDKIGHGNLKSSNIILDEEMEPCISEYGLKEMGNHDSSSSSYPSSLAFLHGLRPDQRSTPDSDPSANAFQRDVFNFGLILLELLTGRVVQSNAAFSLTKWVHSVVMEEWTVEVFDKSLVSEGASEERMVYLLRVALNCVNKSPDARPTSAQVASVINVIKEEEERASP